MYFLEQNAHLLFVAFFYTRCGRTNKKKLRITFCMDFFFRLLMKLQKKLDFKCNFLGNYKVTNKSHLVTSKLRIKNYFSILIQMLSERSGNNSLILRLETTFQKQGNNTIFQHTQKQLLKSFQYKDLQQSSFVCHISNSTKN